MKKVLPALVCLLVLWAGPALAGWVITEEAAGKASVSFVQDNALKSIAPALRTLFEVDKGIIHFYKPETRVIWSGTPAAYLEEMERIRNLQAQAFLATAPPDKRAAVKAQLDAQMKAITTPQKYQVKLVGPLDGGKVAGHKTRKYQIFVEGGLQEEVWLAMPPGFEKDLNLVRFNQLSRAFVAPGVRSWEKDPKVLAMRSTGWPFKTVEYGPKGEKVVTQVVKVEKRLIKKFQFQPPKGYRRVTLGQILQ